MPSHALPPAALPVAGLLPNQPALAVGRQQTLTQQHLLPALPALEAYLLALREQIDPPLRQHKPIKLGKPYPLGQCLEICKAMQAAWRAGPQQPLAPLAQQGADAFSAFTRAGGSVRQVWGDLRGCYFQNAFQWGGLYVDVANDTVTATKPKIELLPLEDSGLCAIRDFRHYAAVAARYWQGELVPNHLLPGLAPYFPWLHLRPSGQASLCDASDYMLALAMRGQFHPSETVLADAPVAPALFAHLHAALHAGGVAGLAESPAAGRQAALANCRHYRAKRWHLQPHSRQRALQQLAGIQAVLARARPLPR